MSELLSCLASKPSIVGEQAQHSGRKGEERRKTSRFRTLKA